MHYTDLHFTYLLTGPHIE